MREGRVRVAGYGEAAITVWYSNLVAVHAHRLAAAQRRRSEGVCRGAAAQLHRRPGAEETGSAAHPAVAACTDDEFIRRAFLDAAGILPTPDEVRRFVADPAQDKRAKLIDALLERPEFVDYWTYKWSDLLLVSTRKLPQPAVWAFYQYIRQASPTTSRGTALPATS